MARDVAPHGRLRRYLPLDHPWRRAIGIDVIRALLASREPSPQQLEMLVDTFHLAEGIARQAEAARRGRHSAVLFTRGRRHSAVLFTRDPVGDWRGRVVPLLAALTAQTEGEA
jgi:hypothetical protein